jgi:hypothetical protein
MSSRPLQALSIILYAISIHTVMFQAFTHPESSHSILAQEAEDLFVRHDANGDGTITEEEFLKDPFIEFEQVRNKSRINKIGC